MSNIPANLKYSKSHEWILEEDGVFTIGDPTMPRARWETSCSSTSSRRRQRHRRGVLLRRGVGQGGLRRVLPVTGTVTAVNEALLDDPAQVNEAPYEAWLIKVSQVSDTEELLDAEGYEAVVAAEEA